MNAFKAHLSNTHLGISLHNYVAYVQEQMKPTDRVLSNSGKAVEQQTKREQLISRHLVKTLG